MEHNGLAPIIGESLAIKRAVALVERFAATGLAILLVGATGTGKDLFARHIHYRSRRRGPFVDVNCGALPHDMVESLLFGHRRGAFTGAVESTVGHIERANGGTLFLDELLSLPVEGQVKLLRALETGEVQPLGAAHKRTVDVRVVAAVQEDASQQLAGCRLRRDLYQRLAGVVIELVPLAERPDDILPLAEYFAAHCGRVLECGATQVLANHAWPGNVRELRLAIERAGCLVENGTLSAAAVLQAIEIGAPRGVAAAPPPAGQDIASILASCERTGWRAAGAAAALGINRATLYRRLKARGVTFTELRQSHQLRNRRATRATEEP